MKNWLRFMKKIVRPLKSMMKSIFFFFYFFYLFLKDAFNLEKFLNTLDKSDRKKYDILNYLNYMMSNWENYNQQLEV